MAAIDKTYVNKKELSEAIEWTKSVGTCTLENGHQFIPLNFIYGYNDLDDPEFDKEERQEYVLWNTPTWYDRWLWLNCPLKFVKDRLKTQYSEEALKDFETYEWKNPKNYLEFGHQHYTFLKVPEGKWHKWYMQHGRRTNPYLGTEQLTYMCEISNPRKYSYLGYNHQTDTWEDRFGMMPGEQKYYWHLSHKRIPTKKSIIRQLRKWYIPKGYIIKIYQLKYKELDFEILVK